ncbi:MAG: enoyl-CoA hydratase/isomerase family protein [Microbacterium gubbeenense]|uniref:enoyl-CoA hydratase/isomerase family protein n=1 Tax=Microbacterium gubbeenense TaxID=159896 RepID=UPI003F968C17
MSVGLGVSGGVATLSLDRPDEFNAIDIGLARSLERRVNEIAASDAEIVVLRASGRGFCAGGDVRAMAAAADPSAYLDQLVEAAHRALTALRALPQPVVARVQGAVAGGGIGLMLTADIAIASEKAHFTPAYGAIGLSPDCGGTALIADAVGDRRARAFFLLGDRLSADTAAEWGLVTRTVPAESLDEAVDGAVRQILAQGADAPRATKRLLGFDGTYAERLAAERLSIVDTSRTAHARTQITAFANR